MLKSRVASGTPSSRSPEDQRRLRRNRWLILTGAAVVVVFAITFAAMTIQALQIRKANGSVFAKYVLDHNIGTAQIATDASGFQGDFCVLQLYQPIPASQLEQESLSLMKQYHQLDGGTNLNIVYRNAATNKQVSEASLVYDSVAGVVHMTLLEGIAHVQTNRHVDWKQKPAN